jgi:sarcosine oxidase, subunit beta
MLRIRQGPDRRLPLPARYSAWSLAKRGYTRKGWPALWHQHDLAPVYDVVIVGGGVHGLATAYYLARNHGIARVAVIEKSYIGSGGSGRNTAIVRSNYLTPEGVRFYDRALTMYNELSEELNFNTMFSRRGHLTLAHSDSSLRTMRWRAEVNKWVGVDSEVIGPAEIKSLAPALDVTDRPRHPILGALYHPPGGIIRHDAVVWAYARAAAALGVEIHQSTEVTGIEVRGGAVTGVVTTRGSVDAPVVINCTAGWASTVAAMAGVDLPITTYPLQAAVTEPVQFFLEPVVVSGSLHVYLNQTERGEVVLGAAVDPFSSYSMRGSFEFTETVARHALDLVPSLADVRLLRQWAGLCDMTPDFSPIISETGIGGFFVDVGWGTYGFKAAPAAAEGLAALVATGRTPPLIGAFGLDRFMDGTLVGEKGAASVGH